LSYGRDYNQRKFHLSMYIVIFKTQRYRMGKLFYCVYILFRLPAWFLFLLLSGIFNRFAIFHLWNFPAVEIEPLAHPLEDLGVFGI